MDPKEKLKFVLSLAHRARGNEPEDLPLKARYGDEFVDISTLDGVPGRFHVRVRDIGCEEKELLRVASTVTAHDEQGRLQVQALPFKALTVMIREGMLLGWRLPTKHVDDKGNDVVVPYFHDATKGDKEAAIQSLSDNLDQGLASAMFATIDAQYGITGGTTVEEVLEEAGNLPAPPASTEETS